MSILLQGLTKKEKPLKNHHAKRGKKKGSEDMEKGPVKRGGSEESEMRGEF